MKGLSFVAGVRMSRMVLFFLLCVVTPANCFVGFSGAPSYSSNAAAAAAAAAAAHATVAVVDRTRKLRRRRYLQTKMFLFGKGNVSTMNDRQSITKAQPVENEQSTLSFSSSHKEDNTRRNVVFQDDPMRQQQQLVRKFVTAAVSIITVSFIVMTASTEAVYAVDHPADYAILGIPTPAIDLRYFVSGSISAATSHGITTPIDVVKTKIQANPDAFQNKNVFQSAKQILDQEGSSVLLGGLAPTIVGYGLEGGAKFGFYESLKIYFAALLPASEIGLAYLIASVTAGAVASLVLCPMERTRIRLVTDPSFASEGLLSGIQRLATEDGASSLFGGITAMFSKQIPYTLGKQCSFDVFAGVLYGFATTTLHFTNAEVKFEVSLLAAFLASLLACIASQPGDVILTTTYKQGTTTSTGIDTSKNNVDTAPSSSLSFLQIVGQLYEEKGLPGFYSGITARFFHVGAIITSQLVLYDLIKQSLGLPATGAS